MNLYEFSQVNNNEMGIHVSREDDAEMYKDAYEEAQRIIRISDEVRVSLEKIKKAKQKVEIITVPEEIKSSKITSSKLASKLKLKTPELIEKLVSMGYIEEVDDKQILTDKGTSFGGEAKKGRFGAYFIWPENFQAK